MPTSPPGNDPIRTPACAGAPCRATNARQGGFTFMRRSADHGFTSTRRSAEHGFTLVELMVTITVIALMSAAVVWAMPDPRGRVRDDALRFAGRVKAARDEAVVGAEPVSVWVTAGGYGFDRRSAGQWHPLADKPLRAELWTPRARADVGDQSGRVRVTFDPTGLPDRAADVRLDLDGRAMLIRIGGDGSVRADAQ